MTGNSASGRKQCRQSWNGLFSGQYSIGILHMGHVASGLIGAFIGIVPVLASRPFPIIWVYATSPPIFAHYLGGSQRSRSHCHPLPSKPRLLPDVLVALEYMTCLSFRLLWCHWRGSSHCGLCRRDERSKRVQGGERSYFPEVGRVVSATQ